MAIGFDKPIADLCRAAGENIDAEAGRVRLKYITDAPGQQATYMSKLENAKAYVAAGYPNDASAFLWINAEAIAVGITTQEAADYIISTAAQWEQIGATIEGARQAAKQALKTATTPGQVYQIEQAFKAAIAVL